MKFYFFTSSDASHLDATTWLDYSSNELLCVTLNVMLIDYVISLESGHESPEGLFCRMPGKISRK